VKITGDTTASPDAVVIPGVPPYSWHHGCGPTAAGMVIGYWDGNGFDALVPGSAATQTVAVNEMIASEGPASNYTDYCLPIDNSGTHPQPLPDLSEPPAGDEHPDECVADFMKTSQSAHWNYYGWSWFSDVGPALEHYVKLIKPAGYYATTSRLTMGWNFDWNVFRAEIDAGRPLVFLVDTNADGNTDHFVTAIGYDVVDDVLKYACFDTWTPAIHWEDFAQMTSGQPWGIYGAVTFQITAVPTDVVITGPTSGTIQVNYTFTATVSPVSTTLPISYVWQVEGQSPISDTGGLSSTVVFSWNVGGPQTITVTAGNLGDPVTATHVITIEEPLKADFTAWPTEGVAPLDVVFTNTSTGDYDTSLWRLGDGVTSTLESPTYTYAIPGAYSVTLTISGSEGTDTLTRPQFVNVLPVLASFEATPTTGPPPLTVTFTNTSVGSYTVSLWQFGDGLTSTLDSPTHTYTALGLYTVTLIVTGPLGSDAVTETEYIDVWEQYRVYLPLVVRNY
jgi:PKD repeat protein